MVLKTTTLGILLALFTCIHSSGDEGRDPCKTVENGFGLTCSNITSQFFSSAMFFSLDDDIARFTDEMKKLEIQQSEIDLLQTGSFKGMPLLSYLIMANVSLKRIERGAFEGLTRLKMVDLSHNRLEEIPADAFKDTRISYLNLEGNRDLRIPMNGPLLIAKRLRSLILSKCDLDRLPGSVLSEVVDLSHLDLSENRLEALPTDIFAHLHHLDYLDLSGNAFRTFDLDTLQAIPSYPHRPTSVLLSGNPWICDCRITKLIEWTTKNPVNEEPTSVFSVSRLRKRTECREPENTKGISWNDFRLRKLISSC